jgi:hypothetical protein
VQLRPPVTERHRPLTRKILEFLEKRPGEDLALVGQPLIDQSAEEA